jgi:hypothetical protein
LCFLCDSKDCQPMFCQVLPDHDGQLLAAPLCHVCRGFPQMTRLGRCLKVLKKMWTTRNGKAPVFHFQGSSGVHPR